MICRPCYRCHVTNDFPWWGLVGVYPSFPASGLGMAAGSVPGLLGPARVFCVREAFYIYMYLHIYAEIYVFWGPCSLHILQLPHSSHVCI